MNDELRRIRDDYLRRLQRALRGVSADLATEIEREIRAHIEDALAARPEPTVGALLDVLDRLGPPEDYAPDLGLYMMVDRGYREWSLRHMLGSARFWALSTAAGAISVVIFGLLYAGALGVTAVGVGRLLGLSVLDEAAEILPGVPAGVLLLAGPAALVAITIVLRWFIGQYVRRARPDALGGEGVDDAWAGRASRRIVLLAMVGLVMLLLAALAAGAIHLDAGTLVIRLRPPEPTSWPALIGWAGILLFFLAPVIGLLWSTLGGRPEPA